MKDFHSTHLVRFEMRDNFTGEGYTVLPVLGFLVGQVWGEMALAYCSALRPSCIRVTTGLIKLDACTNRITVYTEPDDTITAVEMEVSLGLPEGVRFGADFTWHHGEATPCTCDNKRDVCYPTICHVPRIGGEATP